MCGGKSTTTQQTTIPPEVMARYNAVNLRAEDVAQQPFQRYGGEFVAPLTATQQAGIGNVNQSAGLAQGAFNQAQNVQQNAYSQATPYLQQAMQSANTGYGQASNQFGQAGGYLTNAASQGQIYGGQAYQPIAGALSATQPYMQQATGLVTGGLGAAAPMMGAAEGYLGGGTQAIGPQEFGQAQINKYMSPYMRNVVEAQQALQLQENAAQRNALNAQAIGAGAFGGDRAGISQANLARQQSLANQATLGGLLQQGYGQAANMFQQQQGVNLAAAQANRAAQQFGSQQAANLAQQRYAQQMGAGQQLAALGQQQFAQNIGAGQAMAGLGQQMYQQGLGASQAAQGLGQAQYGMGAQQAGLQQGIGSALFGMGTQQAGSLANLGAQQQAAALQGAQAQIGAGTLEQQTRQAEDTARYNEFLQERGYPFQVAQFLANIAMGTGALSGSTTTTTQPNSFFSDRRLKKDIKEIGETHDGLPIYSFKYKEGDDQPRIGVMADEAREKHPDAVHRVGGIDAVDYEKIANRASEGGGVMPHRAGEGFAEGGHVSAEDLASILAMQKQFLGPHGQSGLYGQSAQNLPGGKGIVPQMQLPVARLQKHSAPQQQQSGMQQAMSQLRQAEGLGETLLGDKGIFTKGGIPAKVAQQAGLMPSEEQSKSAKQAQSATQTTQTPASNKGAPPPHPNAPPPANVRVSEGNAGVMPEEVKKEEIDPLFREVTVARGGVIPHKASGGHLQEKVLPYQSTDPYGVEAVNEAESGDKYELMKPDSPPPKGKSGFENVLDAAKLATKVVGMFMLKDGGVVPRMPFQQGGNSGEQSQYKIEPVALEDMPEHRQKMVLDIYGPESGGRYDIRNGGRETFDPNGPHPGRAPAKGGTSSASGAGQFIYDTWQRVTGGAPMTKPYQDNATWTLAAQDYNKRTGRDLDADLQESGGVTPEIRRVLAPTWEAYAKTGGVKPSDDQPRRQVAGAEAVLGEGGSRREYVDGKPVSKGVGAPMEYRTGKPFESVGDFLTSRQFIVPLLSGVGAMASSPSRYFGGALLQGLGAAAQSYAGMEKPIVEGERGRAETAGVEQINIQRSVQQLPDGTKIVWVRGPSGPTFMRYSEYNDLKLQGREPSLLGSVPSNAESLIAENPDAVRGGGAGIIPAAPKFPAGANANIPLSPEAAAAAREEKNIVEDGGNAAVANAEMSKSWYMPTVMRGSAARGTIKGSGDLAQNISDSVQPGQGFDSVGFGSRLRAQYASFANTFLRSIGEQPISKLDEREEVNRKLALVQAEMNALSGNQRADATLDKLLGAQPTLEMTPEASAKLAADLWVARQREIDKDNFRERYGKASNNSFARADAYFQQEYSLERYQKEQALIQRIILEDPTLLKDMRSGKLKPEQIERFFEKKTGENYPQLSRYFVTGSARP